MNLSALLASLRISKNQVIISQPNLRELQMKYSAVWKDKEIPSRQLRVTAKQLSSIDKVPAIADLITLIRQTNLSHPHILEVGCSTGYHLAAFKKAKVPVVYEGCDYSSTFIDKARELYPKVPFKVSDATKLDYGSNRFDIVISGGCILHIIDYQRAIKEAVRVAKKYVIFHRTPIIHMRETTYTKKIGYGLEMVEILFNEGELTNLFYKNKLVIVALNSHGQFDVPGLRETVFMKSYLCRKST